MAASLGPQPSSPQYRGGFAHVKNGLPSPGKYVRHLPGRAGSGSRSREDAVSCSVPLERSAGRLVADGGRALLAKSVWTGGGGGFGGSLRPDCRIRTPVSATFDLDV